MNTPRGLVSRLLEDDTSDADSVYQRGVDEHPEWWEGYHQGEVDAGDFADKILDKFLRVYSIEPGSNLADLVYENIYAGLT